MANIGVLGLTVGVLLVGGVSEARAAGHEAREPRLFETRLNYSDPALEEFARNLAIEAAGREAVAAGGGSEEEVGTGTGEEEPAQAAAAPRAVGRPSVTGSQETVSPNPSRECPGLAAGIGAHVCAGVMPPEQTVTTGAATGEAGSQAALPTIFRVAW